MEDTQPQGTEPVEEQPQEAQETAPEPMPSSDQTQVEQPKVEESTETLPEGVKDRTRREFDKLRSQLREANEALAQRQPQSSTPYPYLNQQDVQNIQRQFTDEVGNVDVDAMERAMYSSNQYAQAADVRARRAEERIAQLEQTIESKETYTKYQSLNPSSKEFDDTFSKLVRDRLLAAAASGQNVSFVQAADEISQVYQPKVNVKKVEESAVQQYKQAQAARNQGPIESGQGETRQSVDIRELRKRTRSGDDRAFNDRFNSIMKNQPEQKASL